MELQLSPERQAQLNDYANRLGQDPSVVLDEIVADALDWERRDSEEAVEGIRRGYADFKAGRVRSVADSFAEVREKHGLSR
jgi:predicted transcriptional regulator